MNRPLRPHQFDERGLGLADGDLVLNHLEPPSPNHQGRRAGEAGPYGEQSVLRPATCRPRPVAVWSRLAGRIYTTASLKTSDAGMPIFPTVAVDPETGEVTKLMDDAPGRLRVAPGWAQPGVRLG